MNRSIKAFVLALVVSIVFGTTAASGAQTPAAVTTYHYDNARTGADTHEFILTPDNVDVDHFGKLFSLQVDSTIYTQPLYVPGVHIPGLGVHNVIYVATANNSVYAFDADKSRPPLWSINIGPVQPKNGCPPQWNLGIMGTPVISGVNKTIYFGAATVRNGVATEELHALDITTGAEQPFSPAVITANVPGTGYGSVDGVLTFSPFNHRQRPALLLDNGRIYIGFTSSCDYDFFASGHGWLFSYDPSTLRRRSVFVSSPNGYGSGIWMSGGGPAADSSHNIYFATANGDFDVNLGGIDYGDSVIKLASGTLSVLDFFTPTDQATLAAHDRDLGSGGVMLLPNPATSPSHLMVMAGKQNLIYLINRNSLGHYSMNGDRVVQEVSGIVGQFSTPAFWNNNLYFVAAGHKGDFPKAFSLSDDRLSTSPTSQAAESYPFPGAVPIVSSNGQSDGILWALERGGTLSGNEVLHAYDATNLANELYNSDQASNGRDLPGIPGIPFQSITVANGKVYVPNGQRGLAVFGLLR